jgi:predicted glycoside hydrolase/deacetylase ChbG (UPF0249 family)
MKASASRTDGFAERQPKGLLDGFAERTKRIVLCADDFAVHEAASRGIAQLATMGRLSATSVMVLSRRWPQDVALLQELRGRIDVGLHLDWTSDFAIAAGHGCSLNVAMLRALLGGFDVAAARSVIERQLDAFEAQWKAPPDHVDGHQHVQQFAGIRQALVQVLRERYGAKPPYLRVSQAPAVRPVASINSLALREREGVRVRARLDEFKGRIISAMGASALRELAAKTHIPCAASLSGIYDFTGGATRYAALMNEWLELATEGDIVMCHPASSSEPGDAIGQARQWEFDYLASPAFAEAMLRKQVQLVRGAALYRAPISV